jgi:hypothetical protein
VLLKNKKLLTTEQEGTSSVLINKIISPHRKYTSATFVHIKINNRKVKTIIDSGAETTLINLETVKLLDLEVFHDNSYIQYLAANQTPLENFGKTILNMKLGQLNIAQEAVVIKNLSTNILLGTDFLVKNAAIVNYSDLTLSIGNSLIKLETIGDQMNFFLSTTKSFDIPANSEHVEWFQVPKSFTNSVYVEGNINYTNKFSI